MRAEIAAAFTEVAPAAEVQFRIKSAPGARLLGMKAEHAAASGHSSIHVCPLTFFTSDEDPHTPSQR
jgi:hypothetical protein